MWGVAARPSLLLTRSEILDTLSVMHGDDQSICLFHGWPDDSIARTVITDSVSLKILAPRPKNSRAPSP